MCKAQLLDGAATLFGSDVANAEAAPVDLKALHAKIGSWRWRTFLVRRARQGRYAERKMIINRVHDLPFRGKRRI